MITPIHYVLLSALLFNIGLVTLIFRRQRYAAIAGTQLLFQATLLALAALAHWFQDWNGEIAAIVVVVLGAITGGATVATGLETGRERSGTSEQSVGPERRAGPRAAQPSQGEDRA